MTIVRIQNKIECFFILLFIKNMSQIMNLIQSIKNFEAKVAEMISSKKLNDELKEDIQKLGTIINEVDDNLINLKNMLK